MSSVCDVVNSLHDFTDFQSLTEQIDTTQPLGKAMLHMVKCAGDSPQGAASKIGKRRNVDPSRGSSFSEPG